ncbi:DUF2330 domain-containing protein, partial [Candidatus Bathyarchaeota archaeon]|nr:DUF2330 domain-containing protein [Candidatus Bathyarchaeota archaeon]
MRPIKGNRSKTFFGFLLIALVLLAINTLLPSALGDRGGFSPRAERVVEAGQKAIVAWNGTDEVLILSTDISSSNETEVVEIMPLPSNPAISKGETQSFQKVTDLVNSYFDLTANRYRSASYSGRFLFGDGGYSQRITITFQQVIGPHFLTVVRVDYSSDLVSWLSDFLRSRGYVAGLPSGSDQLFENYVKNNVRFFVIDAIDTNSTVRTVEPLVYEFSSSKLYYPLRISNLFSGDTSISLFTLTNNEIHQDSLLGGKFSRRADFQIKKEMLPKISDNLTNLFFANPHLSYFSYQGPQSSFDSDVLAEQLETDFFDTSAVAIATLNVGMGLTLLLLFAPLGTTLPRRLPKLATPKRVQLTALAGGFFGTILILMGFVLPWGIGGFGENGEVLMPANGIYTISRPNAFFGSLYPLLLLAVIPCCVYFLLTGGRSRKTAEAFVAIGTLAASWATTAAFFLLETIGIGIATTLTGCEFIVLAGLLSIWHMKVGPVNRSRTSH